MKVVVTGAAGFIGSHVAEALIAEGHDVVGIDAFTDYYPRELKERNLADLIQTPAFTFRELDLRSDRLTSLLDGVDAVVHEAAMPGLTQSWTRFEDYVSCNLLATRRLLEAAREARLQRFVHASTSSVYGTYATGDEAAPTRPMSPYGVTKLAAEQLVLAYGAAFGVPAIVLRYFSVYGPRQRPDMAYGIFIRALLEGRSITVFGDGSASRTCTFVSDCVRGTLGALAAGRIGEVYNLGGGQPITVAGAIRHLAEVIGVDPTLEYAPPRAGDQADTRAVIDKARSHFGYEPRVQVLDGLARQVEWQRTQYRSDQPETV